jgi:hypothetical protein
MTDRDRIAAAIRALRAATPALEAAMDGIDAGRKVELWRAAYHDAECDRALFATLLLQVLEVPGAGGHRLRVQIREALRRYAGTEDCAAVMSA